MLDFILSHPVAIVLNVVFLIVLIVFKIIEHNQNKGD